MFFPTSGFQEAPIVNEMVERKETVKDTKVIELCQPETCSLLNFLCDPPELSIKTAHRNMFVVLMSVSDCCL